MEYTYLECELKYLLGANQDVKIEDIITILIKEGYSLGERKGGGPFVKTRTKLEEYFDDDNFTLLKRGDVLRRTRHIWYNQNKPGDANFMYKENVAQENDLFASRIEKKDLSIKTLAEFVQKFNIPVIPDSVPKLTATILRTDTVMVKDKERYYITLDHTLYKDLNNQKYDETMLEIEDKTIIPEHFHLRKINDVLFKSGLLITPTRESKYERGCQNLLEIL